MVRILKEAGAYYFYPVTGGSVVVVCLMLWPVIKAGLLASNVRQVRINQHRYSRKNLDDITKEGGLAYVINEDNVNLVEVVIQKLNSEAK